MTTSPDFQTLYHRFDRLIDLSVGEQQSELESLRKSGDPLAMQLEGMLVYHQHQSPTESIFSVEELMSAVKAELPWKIASDLRELSRRLRWDSRNGCFQLGHFSLIHCLSVSAIGATYHAHDQSLARDVVLLLLFPRWSANQEVRQRSLEASRAVAKVSDPHVAMILGTIELEGIFAVVRQWIPGRNLDQWMASRDSISLQQIRFIGRGIALGLQAIHEEQVLHGDLKPANIILRKDTLHPVITDFGTATWISPHESTKWNGGTKGFVAPEILRNEPPSTQSDLYSLGVILQWLTTGVFDRETSARDWERASQRLSDTKTSRDGLSHLETLRSLLEALLNHDPAKRPRDMKTLVDSLAPSNAEASYLPQDSQALDSERSHGGTRPLLWDRPRSRRQWIGHAIGLGSTAVAATWGGSFLAKRKKDGERIFVPGTVSTSSIDLFLAPLPETSSLEFISESSYSLLPHHDRGAAIRPARPGVWEWLSFQPVQLPSPAHLVGLLQFDIYFDVDPGQAFYRIEGQLDPQKKNWSLLHEGTNLFGGSYIESIPTHLGSDILATSGSIWIRVGMMFKRAARYQTDLPPIALRLKKATPPYQAGILDLWDRLDSKTNSERG